MENKALAILFREWKALLKLTGETNEWRLKAYDRAANQIDLLGQELRDVYTESGPQGVEEYLKTVRNIGAKSTAKILEFLTTGANQELEALRVLTANQFQQDEMELGPVEAAKNAEPTRRPWAEADKVAQIVLPIIGKHLARPTVCGSYRRNKPTVKDIDVVCVGPKDAESKFDAILNELGVTQATIIKKGPAQTSFWYGGFQIDIWCVPNESYGSAILFATGSADFNIQMRGWLKGQGMKINRYGLYTREGNEWLAGETEEQIFEALNLTFVPPAARINFERP